MQVERLAARKAGTRGVTIELVDNPSKLLDRAAQTLPVLLRELRKLRRNKRR